MHPPASHSSHMIFIKTEKGQEEVARRRFGLDMRHRRMLIMIDGKKSLSALMEMLPKGEMENVIAFLFEHGFVAPTATPARVNRNASRTSNAAQQTKRDKHDVADRRTSAARTPAHTLTASAETSPLLQDPAKLRQVKDFMTTTATTYLGLLSADVIHRIERAESAAQLLNVVGPWHMALRESKQGHRFAGPYLAQVTSVLNGRDAQLEVA